MRIALAALGVVAIGLLAFFAYGGVGSVGSGKGGLSSWIHNTGLGQSIGTLRGDNHSVTVVFDRHLGTGALHTVCAVLTDDSATAMSDLPSPDTQLNELLARAYETEYRAGNDCYSASANASLEARASGELAQGQVLLSRAISLVDQATHRPLSTTTTTTPDSGGIFG